MNSYLLKLALPSLLKQALLTLKVVTQTWVFNIKRQSFHDPVYFRNIILVPSNYLILAAQNKK